MRNPEAGTRKIVHAVRRCSVGEAAAGGGAAGQAAGGGARARAQQRRTGPHRRGLKSKDTVALTDKLLPAHCTLAHLQLHTPAHCTHQHTAHCAYLHPTHTASMSSTSQRVNAPDARRLVTYPRREALLDVHEIQLPNGLSPHPFPVGSLEPSLAAIAAQHACSGGATARGQRP